MKNLLIFCLLLSAITTATIRKALTAEKDYTDLVLALKDKINSAPFKHSAYDRLAYITDTYGPRMWGSMAL